MRRIVLDTETTGLVVEEGHRVIELACLELYGRRATGRHFHRFVNPERDVDLAATQVHGMTAEDLQDKPRFAEIADEFLDFVQGSELLIHNAPFDLGFLNAELARIGRPRVEAVCTVADTLMMAREMHPGKRNSLDALCERYAVEHSQRTLHGALLDAQLLADVWLAMTRGQETLDIGLAAAPSMALPLHEAPVQALLHVIRASAEELARHAQMCERIERESQGKCLWVQLAAAAG
jgi:DNA polymerase-3 subunit epsilon